MMSSFDAVFQFDSAVFWAGVGILLLVAEVIFFGGFYLSFAAAAFIMAILVWLDFLPESALWKCAIFAGLGVALVPPLKIWLRQVMDKTPDINRY